VALQQNSASGDSSHGMQPWQEAAVEWHDPRQHSISVQQAVTAAMTGEAIVKRNKHSLVTVKIVRNNNFHGTVQ